MLEDYTDNEKLELYYKIQQILPTGRHLVTYNLKRMIPDVDGKTVLDLPCGMGSYVREMFKLGASKVIAGDVVSHQLDFSKEKDKEAGIPDGFVDYHQIDAKIPRKLCNELTDVCLSFHLLCFAESKRNLCGMIQTIFMNLKAGGCCLMHVCSLNDCCDSQSVKSELEKICDEKVIHVDPPSNDKFTPRRYHTEQEGFHFDRYTNMLACPLKYYVISCMYR